MTKAGTDARSPALDAVFEPVHPPTTFEETVERLGTAIRLGLLAPKTKHQHCAGTEHILAGLMPEPGTRL
jgi:hypothetical protein